MLKRLYISNYALISEMEINFPGGLTVITGETGAGKSIFLEALGLALGKRADLLALKNVTRKCVVEAEFEISGLNLGSFFEQNDIESAASILLRREIGADGKSRSFLNDSPVNLNTLKVLAENLIDVHSQHENMLLNKISFQMDILDSFCSEQKLFTEYRQEYNKLLKIDAELRQLMEQEAVAHKELDYQKFLFDELEQVELNPGVIKQLEQESLTLENAESIKTSLLGAAYSINGGDENVLSLIGAIKQQIAGLSKFGQSYQAYSDRMNSLQIEVKELAVEMQNEAEDLEVDYLRLEEVNQRLDKLNRLLKKHSALNEEDLLRIKDDLEEKLTRFNSLETTISLLKKQSERSKAACNALAGQITKERIKAIPAIEVEIKETLIGLSMEKAQFRIHHTLLPEPGPTGVDAIQFLFTANAGQELSPIDKVASGGELSRLMLAIKALVARRKKLPSIIFDEIDTGVSGFVAGRIGNILSGMGENMQVITITHLPQIACKGRHHLYVYKSEEAGKTVSHMRELNAEERINEVAKMLSAGLPTKSALKNAAELLHES